MKERRKSERANCRLSCRVLQGKQRIRSRIVDVSEGGLCLLSPAWLKPKEEVQISIDVPGSGASTVRAEIWHMRREKSRTSGNKVWIAGVIVLEADDCYRKLLKSAGVAGEPEKPGDAASSAAKGTPDPLDQIPTKSFRIRCKAQSGPRSRVLTLAAESEEEARSFAVRDLGGDWVVLEIRQA